METINIELPSGIFRFETQEQFFDFAKSVECDTHCTGKETICTEPDKYPCLGFYVHTHRELDNADSQVWAFVYPTN